MAWVMPVGAPGGLNSGFGGVVDGSGMVRLGSRILVLEPDLYRLWQRAAAVPELDELLAWADAEGIEDAESFVQRLREEGLLITETPDAFERIGAFALNVTGELVGNGTDPRGYFVVAGRNGSRLGVGIQVFEILLRSDGGTPLRALSDGLDGLCGGLPALVRNDVVRLNERAG